MKYRNLILLALAAVVVTLSGCGTVGSVVPSLKYCDSVDYSRRGEKVTLMAECEVPQGKMLRGL